MTARSSQEDGLLAPCVRLVLLLLLLVRRAKVVAEARLGGDGTAKGAGPWK